MTRAVRNATMTPAGGELTARATATRAARTSSALFSARKTIRPIPRQSGIVALGARNFSGASINEIAATMPDQRKVAAIATADPTLTRWSLPLVPARRANVPPGPRLGPARVCRLAPTADGPRTGPAWRTHPIGRSRPVRPRLPALLASGQGGSG